MDVTETSARVHSPDGLLAAYAGAGFESVEGWLSRAAVNLTLSIDEFQKENRISGDMCEIGVHHGKFFILFYLLCRESEKAAAIDLFESQHLNVDRSGCGSSIALLENLSIHAGGDARLCMLKRDSLTLSTADLGGLTPTGHFRLFSIDGGHTPIHTVHDISLAADTLAGGGAIFVDDYFNAHWPGVSEGVNRFFALGTPRIAPFCICNNKMLFAHYSWAGSYLKWLQERAVVQKQTTLFGHPVLVVS